MPTTRSRWRKRLAITVTAVLGVVVLALGTVLVVGGIFVPATYLQPWKADYYKQFSDVRMKVVAQALLAPSGHNMQPWTIRLDPRKPDVLYLYADPRRLTPAVDPRARQTVVSQGTFLAYLRIAAEHLGYRANFALFPSGAWDESNLAGSMSRMPVARITLVDDPSVRAADYASLYLSDTNRAPYTSRRLSAAERRTLSGLDPRLSGRVRLFTDTEDVRRLGNFGVEGTLIESRYAAATRESDRLFFGTEQAKDSARSGFAVEGQGTSGIMKYLLQGAVALYPPLNDDKAGARNAIALTAAAVAHTRAWALLTTPTNSRRDQVEAGILYADLSLRARSLGLVMQPLSQVLQEYPSMAGPYAAIHARYASDGSTIQMMVRIGTPTVQYPQTMRRSASSLVHAP